MTLAEAVDAFLFHCQYEKNLSPKTLRAYALDLRQFRAFIATRGDADPVIAGVGKPVLRDYIQQMFQTLAAKSVKRKVATLKAMFAFLERDEVIAVSPFRKMSVRIRDTRKLPRTIPLDELNRLFRHLYAAKKALQGDPQGAPYARLVRDIAVLELLFASGARVSEVCNLTTDDLNLGEGRVRILGKGARERVIQVCTKETLSALCDYAALPATEETRYLFRTAAGKRLSEQAVRGILRKYCREIGIDRRVTPHMIRHSVATLLLEEGVDIRYIQHLLGHSSITTTQIYTHVHDTSQRQMLLDKHPRQRIAAYG